jgi:hypothetical protein
MKNKEVILFSWNFAQIKKREKSLTSEFLVREKFGLINK